MAALFLFSPFTFLLAYKTDMMAGIPAAILVQEVNSRIKFIHNGGETDIRLEHNDYGVTISALDCPS